LVVNYGQTGYYRTLYTPELLGRLAHGFGGLRPVDQIGLISDNWSLGLAGYQSAGLALDLANAAPADANSDVWSRVAGIIGETYRLYEGDAAHQGMVARYASAKLDPILRRLGWTPRANESALDTLLRTTVIGTLGRIGDREVVAEVSRRFAANDPSITTGPLRETLLGVLAYNADAAQWDRLHALGRAEHNPIVKMQLYRLLGSARDEALARRALDLALTDEPGATTSSSLIGSVAGSHPDLAFDFAITNRARVEALVDASSRSRFIPGLGAGSIDPAMIGKLTQYAEQHMTAQSRAPADRAIAGIRNRLRVKEQRLPDISRWFEAHAAG
jgi:aminopeptidase N